ncbi:hypothetical protein [Thermodesulfobacterium thermophilum]|nr:hypothetical protein [Thermodesulfobacterium thermophilum]
MVTEKEFQMKLVEKLALKHKQDKSKKVKVSISITILQTHPGLKRNC